MRARHEHQIKLLTAAFGNSNSFDRSLYRVIYRSRGMSFFTDEQIAEIREDMIRQDWFRHKLNRENRKRRAAA